MALSPPAPPPRSPLASINEAVPSQGLKLAFEEKAEEWLGVMQQLIDSEVERIRTEITRDVERRRQELDDEWHKLVAERNHLNQEKADLIVREESLDREKQNLQGIRAPTDVLDLNIGGQVTCSVRRATLTIEDRSALSSFFSGRWDESLDRDSAGRIFIDFPPELFMPLVDFLRQKSIEDPADPVAPPKVSSENTNDFKRMLTYYGILDFVWPRPEGRWQAAWGSIDILEDARSISVATQREPYHAAAFNVQRIQRNGEQGWTLLVSKTRADAPWYYDSFAFGVVRSSDQIRPDNWQATEQNLLLNLRGGVLAGTSSVDSTDLQGLMPAVRDTIRVVITQEPTRLVATFDGREQVTTTLKPELQSCSSCLLVAVTYPWIQVSLVPSEWQRQPPRP
eukprot:TRINITY_DN97539_c0_g1_i1.p1 TRINITY_DN97539_c0_g1~~TRINITY_DN97539_c0_g1_i1.p1  ORF type:complete len:416 (-),score=79.22 TRINITY_DN97539_c0_g1_i1:53-1240(-)